MRRVRPVQYACRSAALLRRKRLIARLLPWWQPGNVLVQSDSFGDRRRSRDALWRCRYGLHLTATTDRRGLVSEKRSEQPLYSDIMTDRQKHQYKACTLS